MKIKFFSLVASVFLSFNFVVGQKDKSKVQLKTKLDTISYYLGIEWSRGIHNQIGVIDFNYNAIIKGMKDERNALPTLPQTEVTYQKITDYFMVIKEAKLLTDNKDNIEKNKKFLEENKVKEGVVSLPSGIQYKVITQGSGEKPIATDKVTVHYTGTLIDGTVFDSSVERGEPATFGVQQVIAGWTEILQLMPIGSKWTVYIPEDKAYGSRNAGQIPPYSTLIFDIELLEIVMESVVPQDFIEELQDEIQIK